MWRWVWTTLVLGSLVFVAWADEPNEIGLSGVDLAPEATPQREVGTYVCKLDGSDERRLAGPTIPAWLPDGRQLLLATNNALYRLDHDGGRKTMVWRDPQVQMLLDLRVAGSGLYASALGVRRNGQGSMMVWRLSDSELILDDLLYRDAVIEPPDETGHGGRYLSSISAWSPHADSLAWVPMEYDGLAERTRGVKVFDAQSERWGTWYVDRPVWSLTWHTERPSLILTVGLAAQIITDETPAPPVALLDISGDGRVQTVLADELDGAVASDLPMTWLPRCGLFAWGQSFYGADGEPAPPYIPEGEAPTARLLWVSRSGRDLVLAATRVTDEGHWQSELVQGLTGAPWDTFRTLAQLPVLPSGVLASPDGARLVFVVGGYVD
ncbi:MAG TPA: hypothetical protein DCZ72_07140 [Armatimonadetes bacterium]|nr:hypothetical protein [Armatimonadota bacterium]